MLQDYVRENAFTSKAGILTLDTLQRRLVCIWRTAGQPGTRPNIATASLLMQQLGFEYRRRSKVYLDNHEMDKYVQQRIALARTVMYEWLPVLGVYVSSTSIQAVAQQLQSNNECLDFDLAELDHYALCDPSKPFDAHTETYYMYALLPRSVIAVLVASESSRPSWLPWIPLSERVILLFQDEAFFKTNPNNSLSWIDGSPNTKAPPRIGAFGQTICVSAVSSLEYGGVVMATTEAIPQNPAKRKKRNAANPVAYVQLGVTADGKFDCEAHYIVQVENAIHVVRERYPEAKIVVLTDQSKQHFKASPSTPNPNLLYHGAQNLRHAMASNTKTFQTRCEKAKLWREGWYVAQDGQRMCQSWFCTVEAADGSAECIRPKTLQEVVAERGGVIDGMKRLQLLEYLQGEADFQECPRSIIEDHISDIENVSIVATPTCHPEFNLQEQVWSWTKRAWGTSGSRGIKQLREHLPKLLDTEATHARMFLGFRHLMRFMIVYATADPDKPSECDGEAIARYIRTTAHNRRIKYTHLGIPELVHLWSQPHSHHRSVPIGPDAVEAMGILIA